MSGYTSSMTTTKSTEIAGETYCYIERTEVEVAGGTATVEAFEDDHSTLEVNATVSSVTELEELIANLQDMRLAMAAAERVRAGR